jgi:DNA polymerase-3 subunit delta'
VNVNNISDTTDAVDPKLPRETSVFFGHGAAEQALLSSYRSGRLAHAWLLTGAAGIGKATLAYRMARFVLAHPDHASVPAAGSSLQVSPQHPVARRIAAQAHGDLLVLERAINEKTGKLRQEILVNDVRKAVRFFGSTAGEGGWRVAIVDAVDHLNSEGANALLKILEEPPERALLLLLAHSPGRVLPTMRSRCRLLALVPLATADIARAAAAAVGRDAGDPVLSTAAAAADGSVRRALGLLDPDALDLRNRVLLLLDQLPGIDAHALHALGDRLAGTEAASLGAFVDCVNAWLSARLHSAAQARPVRRDMIATAWEKFNTAARETEEFNLDRKPLVFNVFRLLADVCRGC